MAWDEPKKWVSVEKFGAIPNDNKDDTAAFQAAIDSGATTVFVPRSGDFTINGSLRIRGKVRRFIGTSGWLNGKGEIIADNGSEPTLIIENFFVTRGSKLKWKNFANRTVVYRSIVNFNLESNSIGNLFIDDVSIADRTRFLNPAQHIWARQLNPEIQTEINVVNRGARLWILGMKTEQSKTKIQTTNGGFTELLGGLIYTNGTKDPTDPLFQIVNAYASFSGVAEAYFPKKNSQPVWLWVEEKRGFQTKRLHRNQIPARMTTNGRVLLLYSSFDKQPH
ncbi:MAG: glycoside hydrolase family 55 protein [Fischerella sp.]|nr:glycoside hydrolase family 55 protein [Fischerella sp.]